MHRPPIFAAASPYAATLDAVVDMSFAVRLSRVALTAIALVLGSLGIFCLYGSCAAGAIVCLASATAIVLACPATDARLLRGTHGTPSFLDDGELAFKQIT